MKELNNAHKQFLADFCKSGMAKLLPDLLLLQDEYGFGDWTIDEFIAFVINQISSGKETGASQ